MYFYLFIPQVCCENGRGERLYHSLWFVELFKSNKGEVLKTCSDNTGCCSKASPGSFDRWNVMAEIASYAVGKETRQIVRNVVLTEWQRPTLNSMQTCVTTCVSSVAELRECPKMKDITTNIYIYIPTHIYMFQAFSLQSLEKLGFYWSSLQNTLKIHWLRQVSG